MNSPTQRYRVAFDMALERGEVHEAELAKGESKPWNEYLAGAERCERSPEEWEWARMGEPKPYYNDWQNKAHLELVQNRHATLTGPRRCGKTYFAVRELWDAANERQGNYLYATASRGMAEAAAWPYLLQLAHEAGAQSGHQILPPALMVVLANGSRIAVSGAVSMMRGLRFDGIAYDEMDEAPSSSMLLDRMGWALSVREQVRPWVEGMHTMLARQLVPDGVFRYGDNVIYCDRRTHYALMGQAMENLTHGTLSFEYLPPNDVPGQTRPTLMLAGIPVLISDGLEATRPDLQPWVQVTEAFESVEGATLRVALIAADDAALTQRPNLLVETRPIPEALLVPGYHIRLGPPIGPTQRYLGMRYTVTGSPVAGSVSAGLGRAHDTRLSDHQALAEGATISENSLDTGQVPGQGLPANRVRRQFNGRFA